MKPLLWKEFREVRFQFVLWALVFVFGVGSHHFFQPFYAQALTSTLVPLGAALAAIAMGVSNLIQERRTRTLDFLLTRPASGSQIVWAKFFVGSAMTLYIVGLFAAFIYIRADASSGSYLSQAIQEVGLPKLLAVLLPPFWFLYAVTFLISVLVDESAKVFVGAGALFISLYVAGVALSTIPPFLPAGLWFPLSLQTGEWTLVARNGYLLTAVAATWCGLAILAGGLAGRFLDGRREPKSNWLVIAACVALPFVLLFVGPRWAQERSVTVSPAGVYALSEPMISSITADGDRVSVITLQGGLTVIDFSDPAHPRLLVNASLPVRALWGVRLTNDSAYVVGLRKNLPEAFIVLRVNLKDPAAPKAEEILNLGPTQRRLALARPFLIGSYLYLGDGNRIRVFELQAKEGAHETAALAIDGSVVAVKGSYAYVLCLSELVTLDVTDPARPRIARRTPLGLKTWSMPRDVTIAGDGLYTQGYFPTSLLRFDLKDPANPVQTSQTPTGIVLGDKGLASDEASSALMVAYRDGVLAFRPPTGLLLHDVRYLKPSEPSAQHIAIGKRYFFALIEGNRVAAFPLPRIN